MKSMLDQQSTVLLVDDEVDLLDMIKDELEPHFTSVLTAENPIKAFEVLQKHQVDCIVTDYKMPHMNGLEFIKELAVKYPSIPVILLTGNGGDKAIQSAIEDGAFDYLDKPFRAPVLLNRIRNALLLPKLESLILELARYELPDLKMDQLTNLSPKERIRTIGALEGLLRTRLMAKTKGKPA